MNKISAYYMRKKNTYLGYKALYEKIIYFLMILQYVMSHIKEDHQADAMTTTECQNCRQWEDHKGRADSARIHYQLDAEKEQEDDAIRSVDLQRVMTSRQQSSLVESLLTMRPSPVWANSHLQKT